MRSRRLPTADTTSHYKLMHLSEKNIDFQRQSTPALTNFSVERWYAAFHCLMNPMLLSYHFLGLLLAILPMPFHFKIYLTNLHRVRYTSSPIVLGVTKTKKIYTYLSIRNTNSFQKKDLEPHPTASKFS